MYIFVLKHYMDCMYSKLQWPRQKLVIVIIANTKKNVNNIRNISIEKVHKKQYWCAHDRNDNVHKIEIDGTFN